MNDYNSYLQAAGGTAILALLLIWVRKRNKK